MTKRNTKSTKTRTRQPVRYDPRPILTHPSTWIAILLALALAVVYGVSLYGFNHIKPKTELDIAKLTIFDHVIQDYIQGQEINSEKSSAKEVTGYGISKEDGAFYVTFDFIYYEMDENQLPVFDSLQHGVMYFWPDSEHGTYSHAFSYHDYEYHPEGSYTEVGEHNLRNQLKNDE